MESRSGHYGLRTVPVVTASETFYATVQRLIDRGFGWIGHGLRDSVPAGLEPQLITVDMPPEWAEIYDRFRVIPPGGRTV